MSWRKAILVTFLEIFHVFVFFLLALGAIAKAVEWAVDDLSYWHMLYAAFFAVLAFNMLDKVVMIVQEDIENVHRRRKERQDQRDLERWKREVEAHRGRQF